MLLVLSHSLLAESYRLKAEATIVSEAPAAALGNQTARSHPSSRIPPGTWCHQVSTADSVSDRIDAAIATGQDEELRHANLLCREELHAVKHSPVGGQESTAQLRYRIITDYVGVATAVVARREMATEPVIRKIRREAGQDSRGRKALAGDGEGGV